MQEKYKLFKVIVPLCLIALLTVLCLSAASADGTTSDGWIYTEAGGNATITGYTGASKSLNIPATVDGYEVTAIGANAFKNRTDLTGSLTIGNSVTTIGEWAFYNCYRLTGSLTIGNSVTTIGNYAFYDCSGLTESLTISNSVTTIGEGAFAYCTGLTGSLTIPNSVTAIGAYAFWDCSGLTGSLTIPNSVTTIGAGAFGWCTGLTGSLTIPNSVTTIDDNAFYDCTNINPVYVLSRTYSLGSDVFYGYTPTIYGYAGTPLSIYANFIPFGITIKGESTVKSGKTLQLTADPLLPPGETDVLTWTSSNEAVATVDTTGLVSGITPGTITITATATGESGVSGTHEVTVLQMVTGVSLDPALATMDTGTTRQITATVLPADAFDPSIEWVSSDENIATVTATGLVSAVRPGTATITATAQDGSGKSATCEITVTQKVSGITLDPALATMDTGTTRQITATVLPLNASDPSIDWVSSDESIATVDATGLVSALLPGTTTITATAQDGTGKSATCEITVTQKVSGITLDPALATMETGTTRQITATVLPPDASNPSIDWVSSDESIATVDATGLVSALSPGTTTITATAQDGSGRSGTCEITVLQKVTGVSLEPTFTTMKTGTKKQITATVLPANASDPSLSWVSSNESIASVNGNGEVSALSPGTATITATARDGSGRSETCEVTVTGQSAIRITKLQALNGSSLKLTWTKVAGATGYEVWRATRESGPYALAKSTNKTSYTNTYLKPGVRYCFKVRAYKTVGGTRIYLTDYSKTDAGVPLNKAVIKSVTAPSAGRLTISWGKVKGATGYQVLRSTSRTGKYKLVKSVYATTFTNTGLIKGKTYYYKILPFKRIASTIYFGPLGGYRWGKVTR